MNKIEMGKTYKYRNCKAARVLCVDNPGCYPVITSAEDGTVYFHSHYGVGMFSLMTDLVEVIPYSDFKIDDKVMVRNGNGKWCKRYFAGIDSKGKPMAFESGSDSWSYDVVLIWNECRKPNAEEETVRYDYKQ